MTLEKQYISKRTLTGIEPMEQKTEKAMHLSQLCKLAAEWKPEYRLKQGINGRLTSFA